VLFIHGNFSSATWWEETMVKLPPQYRAIAPDQRGFGGADPAGRVTAQINPDSFISATDDHGNMLSVYSNELNCYQNCYRSFTSAI
jgi:pimeloyl-ACP methyl ester carboxylesterase